MGGVIRPSYFSRLHSLFYRRQRRGFHLSAPICFGPLYFPAASTLFPAPAPGISPVGADLLQPALFPGCKHSFSRRQRRGFHLPAPIYFGPLYFPASSTLFPGASAGDFTCWRRFASTRFTSRLRSLFFPAPAPGISPAGADLFPACDNFCSLLASAANCGRRFFADLSAERFPWLYSIPLVPVLQKKKAPPV